MTTQYWRKVTAVLTGSSISQAIPIAGSLIIARQYSPASFGEYASWLAISLLLGTICSARLETRLVTNESPEQRATIAKFIVLFSIIFSSLGAALIQYTPEKLLPGGHLFSDWFSTSVFVASVGIALSNTLQNWAAAEGHYFNLSIIRVLLNLFTVGFQILAGTFVNSAEFLCLGYLAGLTVSSIYGYYTLVSKASPHTASKYRISAFFNQNWRFLILALPSVTLNSVAAQAPVLIVSYRYGTEAAGALALCMRILSAPLSLLGRSVLDVFKREATAEYRKWGNCEAIYIKTLKALSIIATVFGISILAFSESIFLKAYGSEWAKAGLFSAMLAPLFALRFLASPLSYLVFIVHRQDLDLLWQIGLTGITISLLSISKSAETAVLYYSVATAAWYMAYVWLSWILSKGKKQQ